MHHTLGVRGERDSLYQVSPVQSSMLRPSTEEVVRSVPIEIEAIINAKPFDYVSADIADDT